MKKTFFAGVVALSLVALAFTTPQAQDSGNNVPSIDQTYYQDTVPKRKDTTKKPNPDSPPTLKVVVMNK